ncbi:MAG: hypothetical protein EBT74_00995 [Gammaproteobacteria bacterium]|nr:hypothetical protein [Gammaproteobacteria bacterium]
MGNRTTFWLIWGIALVPMLAAFVMYFGGIGVPEGRTHHGELVFLWGMWCFVLSLKSIQP